MRAKDVDEIDGRLTINDVILLPHDLFKVAANNKSQKMFLAK